MPWTIEYISDKCEVVVDASGVIHDEDARAQTAAVIDLLKQNQATNVLLDYSEALSEATLPGLYWLPDYASEAGAPWDARIAIVQSRKPYRIESFQFFELVCRNAGYNARLFETKEAAENWLAQVPSRRKQLGHPVHAYST